MYRSASTTRVADDHFGYHPSSPSKLVSTALRALSLEANELPVYEPLSEAGKKERSRAKFAEHAVHLIPLVLLLCALILWFFSNPNVDMPSKGGASAATIEGLTIEGDINVDGTQGEVLPVEMDDLEESSTKQADHHRIFLGNKFP